MLTYSALVGLFTTADPPYEIALFTTMPNAETGAGGVEASGNGYARAAVTFIDAGDRVQNSTIASFTASGGDITGLLGWGAYNNSGTLLATQAFAATEVVLDTETREFREGDLVIGLTDEVTSAGSLTNAGEIEAALNALTNNPPYTIGLVDSGSSEITDEINYPRREPVAFRLNGSTVENQLPVIFAAYGAAILDITTITIYDGDKAVVFSGITLAGAPISIPDTQHYAFLVGAISIVTS